MNLINPVDEAYRDRVFACIEQEDTPRPLVRRSGLLRSVGFDCIEILHRSVCGAAFGAIKT